MNHPKLSRFIAHIPGVSHFMNMVEPATPQHIASGNKTLARKPSGPTLKM
ncbi:MAG TPA: hypothetical protein VGQ49_11245 [Bryobacteraceae bacterium]|nr:hypothetical protein [Bryobacteraceae bacterium]